jgi:hypothetical protein
MHSRCSPETSPSLSPKANRPFVPGTGDRPKREEDLYYVTTRKSGTTIEGKLPLTAAEALAYLRRANGARIEIRDANDRAVSLEKLRTEAAHPADTGS